MTSPRIVDTPQTMRELFPQFYRPAESDFDELFKTCIVAVDANVLLDFYRVQEETRETLFRIFEGFKGRFWVPHQAGLEFQRNRLKVRDEQRTQAVKVQEGMKDAHKQLLAVLQLHQRHAFLNTPLLIERITDLVETIVGEIQKQVEAYPAVGADDPLHNRITELVADGIGEPYPLDKRDELIKQAKLRFAAKVPPGYKDSGKEGEDAYGDFIVWRQLIDKARETQLPIVFVSRDVKEDWVQRVSGKTIGPRPELVEEMLTETKVRFHLYETDRFMEYAGRFLDQQVSQEAIDEVHDLPLEEVPGSPIAPMQERPSYRSAGANLTELAKASQSPALAAWKPLMDEVRSNLMVDPFAGLRESLAQNLQVQANSYSGIQDLLASINAKRNKELQEAFSAISGLNQITAAQAELWRAALAGPILPNISSPAAFTNAMTGGIGSASKPPEQKDLVNDVEDAAAVEEVEHPRINTQEQT